jgi:hypothetical protein
MSATPQPEPARDAARLDWRIYGLVATVTLAIGIINALSAAYDHARGGAVYALGQPLFWELTSVGMIALLAPAVAAGIGHLRGAWQDRRWGAVAAIAALVVVSFSAVHIVGMVALRQAGSALYGTTYHFDWSPSELLYEFRKDFMTCVTVRPLPVLRRVTSSGSHPPAITSNTG